MQRTTYLCSNFWRFPCERIFLGDVPGRKFEGDPFSFPNRIWKLRDRNWLGKWETVSCVATGAVDCWPQSPGRPPAWSSGSWDTPDLGPQDSPCLPDARSWGPGQEVLCRRVVATEGRKIVHQNWFLSPERSSGQTKQSEVTSRWNCPLLGNLRQRYGDPQS